MPNTTVIADLGCGEAKIARTLTKKKVHSFDLKALNDQVTVCDMSRLPLYRQTVDVAVFCLSLMGTNLNAFILEANRILKKGGLLKIAEVKSRFRNIDGFPKAMKKFGFQFVQKVCLPSLGGGG
uniref:Ribosomal RNA-processing protein 8 n=2 Tax=Ixodes scapularis TaxID=6945 RepID=A0A1S4KXL6_IXOSC